MEKVNPLM